MPSTVRGWARLAVGATCLVLGISACEGRDVDAVPSAAAVRDSAGIRVVDNGSPQAAPSISWGVGESPRVSIGALEGDPAYQLFGAEDALRLPDGRVLIANSGTSEIRVFDGEGEHIDSWGSHGEGPGEFTQLTNLARWPGDSIAAWDFAENRLTLFDASGTLGRTLNLAVGDGGVRGRLEGILPDGAILTAGLLSFGGEDVTTGFVRRSREYVLADPTGAQLATFGTHPDEEYYVRPEVGAIVRHPFRRSVHSAIWNDRVVISPSDRLEVRVYGRSGPLEEIVRAEYALVEVTQADVDRFVAARIDDAEPAARPTITAVFEGMPPVDSYPAFSQLLTDAAGNLWLREYTLPDAEPSTRWTVFGPEGDLLGNMETPAGLTIFRIGTDFILGRATDDFDVEYVQLWDLDRSD